ERAGRGPVAGRDGAPAPRRTAPHRG
ncbi:MAG: hypothetical protein AVDCRST_MAG66-2377, partial [uncultured Pseudonocardia sp.]